MSSDSENEFWSELENHPTLPTTLPSKPEPPTQKFEKALNRLRDSARIEHQNTLKKEINKLHGHYKKEIDKISKGNFKLVETLKTDYEKLSTFLQIKDTEIERLQTLLYEQETFITENRVIKESLKKPIKVETSNWNKEKKSLEIQIEGVRELAAMYHEYSDIHEAELAACKEKFAEKEEEYCLEYRKLQQEKSEAEKEKELEKEAMEDFKADTSREIEVYRCIIHKEQKAIAELEKELEEVKTVLQTPRLVEKIQNRFRNKSIDCGLPSIKRTDEFYLTTLKENNH